MPDSIYADSLGGTIRSNREAQGLSLRQLAHLIDADPAMQLRWERDENVPTPIYLVALAKVLELRAADLFLLAGVPLPDGLPSLPAMLRAEYELPPKAITEIRRSIEHIARKYRTVHDAQLENIETKEKGITYEQEE